MSLTVWSLENVNICFWEGEIETDVTESAWRSLISWTFFSFFKYQNQTAPSKWPVTTLDSLVMTAIVLHELEQPKVLVRNPLLMSHVLIVQSFDPVIRHFSV